MSGTVAVVGAGVSGLTAAYLLQRRYRVLLFEADDRLGGHAHTHRLRSGDGRVVPVDSGFIVHNERTYPNLLRLFGELGVRTAETEMSMSVSCDGCGLEYAGARRLGGLFAQRGNAVRPRYLAMLAQVVRFHRAANRLLDAPGESADSVTLGDFLAGQGFSRYFVDHFALPLVSAVWSADFEVSKRYPARYLFEFLRHHGMLSVGGSPTWRTVSGGSGEYVSRAVERLSAVHVGTPVRSVARFADRVELRDAQDRVHEVDRVVLACHADQALALLADPTPAEAKVLGAFGYSENETWLHSDAGVLPRATGARASWNHHKPSCAADPGHVLVSYDMNRLMRLAEPVDYLVTLNPAGRVRPERVLARMHYRHPIYTPDSVAAQRNLPELGDARTRFAGAYHGWGFHEDGCASGVRAAEAFGAGW
ncbi:MULTISPECIES: NAD(P)/FAD-dependent oxidoreductase [unclassified Saccharopolyspora]|uniref:NAD(P)/FAD-dependent oxidoreductase n=1 Tax=unclassified Saccharopolyspora TaxID=2646250 RepID=UPI001CD1D23D|nr:MULTISPECIES: FAD-dependent oxidoreductase [unclassified Saccharopolyspora]MCA1188033.1 FAD-dependent oxidoreductase [Saccharopolyspora sp. 6T]MCA1196049.1 FAD-dependent oxidoreductase [Saccharopolyspora sp. 6V]MCA1229480.1 FAD-dependent oxidoreductase [Saccharopolyspora sp. 6M]MCA1283454.1 FAD-dependent oxidoreductase [Saccharopolyspora sp. 7B]